MAESLKQKTISGMIWNATERFGSSLLLFISNLILARLLMPDDFGCIGILLVFISVSEAIVDGGFGSALIQKKNPTQADYSTIFYWNIALSLFMYFVLFQLSPAIASFYNIPLLEDILKVQGIILITNALILIQQNILKKNIAFKQIAQINILAIFIGTVGGIFMAFIGYGVWSLVWKSIITGLIQCAVYWTTTKWKPTFVFSFQSFKSLFNFGGFMFLNTLFNALYLNIFSLIIGKVFNSATLGYFTQARKLEDVPRDTLTSIVNNVTFPVFSKIQDDKIKVVTTTRKCIQSLCFINIPLMLMFIVIANPLFISLFSEKWMASIPYFQILCVNGIVLAQLEVNYNLIASQGKSKTNFKIRIIQRIIGICFILVGLHWGMTGLLVGFVSAQYISLLIARIFSGKLVGYGMIAQTKDILPIFVPSATATAVSYGLSNYLSSFLPVFQCIILSTLFIITYIVFSILLKVESVNIYKDLLLSKIRF